jgi:hypothetical protein
MSTGRSFSSCNSEQEWLKTLRQHDSTTARHHKRQCIGSNESAQMLARVNLLVFKSLRALRDIDDIIVSRGTTSLH